MATQLFDVVARVDTGKKGVVDQVVISGVTREKAEHFRRERQIGSSDTVGIRPHVVDRPGEEQVFTAKTSKAGKSPSQLMEDSETDKGLKHGTLVALNRQLEEARESGDKTREEQTKAVRDLIADTPVDDLKFVRKGVAEQTVNTVGLPRDNTTTLTKTEKPLNVATTTLLQNGTNGSRSGGFDNSSNSSSGSSFFSILSAKKAETLETQAKKLEKEEEKFSQGQKRVSNLASTITFGGQKKLEERSELGQTTQLVAENILSVVPSTISIVKFAPKKAALAFKASQLPGGKESVKKELGRVSTQLKEREFNPKTPEGKATFITAGIFAAFPAASAASRSRSSRVRLDVTESQGTFFGAVREGSTFQGQKITGSVVAQGKRSTSQFNVGDRTVIVRQDGSRTVVKEVTGFDARSDVHPTVRTRTFKGEPQGLQPDLVKRTRSQELTGVVQSPELSKSFASSKEVITDQFAAFKSTPSRTRTKQESVDLTRKTLVEKETVASDKTVLRKTEEVVDTPKGLEKQTKSVDVKSIKPEFTFDRAKQQPDLFDVKTKGREVDTLISRESRSVTKGEKVTTGKGSIEFVDRPKSLGKKGSQFVDLEQFKPTKVKVPQSKPRRSTSLDFSLESSLTKVGKGSKRVPRTVPGGLSAPQTRVGPSQTPGSFPASKPVIKPFQGSKSRIELSSKPRQDPVSDLNRFPQSRISQRSAVGVAQSLGRPADLIQRPQQALPTPLSPTGIPSIRPPRSPPVPPRTPKFSLDLPRFNSLERNVFGEKRNPTKRGFRYTPSLTAVGLGIKGDVPKGAKFSGLEIRPLRRKKKKKRRKR